MKKYFDWIDFLSVVKGIKYKGLLGIMISFFFCKKFDILLKIKWWIKNKDDERFKIFLLLLFDDIVSDFVLLIVF